MATPKQIKAKRDRLEARIADLHTKLLALQKECEHELAMATHKADTGNYDRSMDRYWIEHDCPSCGASWITEQ